MYKWNACVIRWIGLNFLFFFFKDDDDDDDDDDVRIIAHQHDARDGRFGVRSCGVSFGVAVESPAKSLREADHDASFSASSGQLMMMTMMMMTHRERRRL